MTKKALQRSLDEPDWEALTPDQFEVLVLSLVREMGLQQAEKTAGTGDRGMDVVAYQPTFRPGIPAASRKWVFQCKRKSRVSKSEIRAELANFQEDIDTWVLVTTATPSVRMQEWLSKQTKTKTAPFYVLAWWRQQLNEYVREYGRSLISLLPPAITEAMNLRGYLAGVEPAGFENILAKCRNFTSTQISVFARGKYIPGLYVERRLQDTLVQFHATEALQAQSLKASVVETIASHVSRLREISKVINGPSAGATRRSRRNKGAAKYVDREWVVLVDRLNELLDLAMQSASKLSETYLLGKESDHHAVLKHLRPIITFVNERDANTDLRVFTQTQERLNLQKVKLSEERDTAGVAEIQHLQRSLGGISPAAVAFLGSDMSRLSHALEGATRHCTILVDRAGGGKTNLLCEVARTASQVSPTAILFGKENFQGSSSLLEWLERLVSGVLGVPQAEALGALDRTLGPRGLFFNLFIDGINESRNIPELDTAIAYLLQQTSGHRIRIAVSCRDVYWSFFESDKWRAWVYQIKENQLHDFSEKEYAKAVPLYFEHFRMQCDLLGPAAVACQHPLLLRFFCEAYGDPEGAGIIRVGVIRDIRLKELFDVYFEKKSEQIRRMLRHRNSDIVTGYVYRLASHLFDEHDTTVATNALKSVTGDGDTVSADSVYLRLLDEDVIIEEEPTDRVGTRLVRFVYEEFMEYILARAKLQVFLGMAAGCVRAWFDEHKEVVKSWVNLRGMCEYLAIMLMEAENKNAVEEGLSLLQAMAIEGGIWKDAFWMVVGRVPEKSVNAKLFDLLRDGLDGVNRRASLLGALETMTRFSSEGARRLASAILWSGLLPNVISWEEVLRLDSIPAGRRTELAGRLGETLVEKMFHGHLKGIGFGWVVESVAPYLPEEQQKRVMNALNERGRPGKKDFRHAMHIVKDTFPEHQAYLINGIFHSDLDVAMCSADRLRFVPVKSETIAWWCRELAKYEGRSEVRKTLLSSAQWVEKRRATA